MRSEKNKARDIGIFDSFLCGRSAKEIAEVVGTIKPARVIEIVREVYMEEVGHKYRVDGIPPLVPLPVKSWPGSKDIWKHAAAISALRDGDFETFPIEGFIQTGIVSVGPRNYRRRGQTDLERAGEFGWEPYHVEDAKERWTRYYVKRTAIYVEYHVGQTPFYLDP